MAISYWVFPSLNKRKYRVSKVTADFYINKVCYKMQVSPQSILKRVRTERIAFARHYIAYFLYNNTMLNLTEVAEQIGRKDHSTVKNSLKVCEKVLDKRNNYNFRNEFIELLEELSSMPQISKKSRKQTQSAFSHPEKLQTNL